MSRPDHARQASPDAGRTAAPDKGLSIKARALRAVLRAFGRMGPAARLRAGRVLGWLALRLARPRARVARRNLELCFPGRPAAERERWLREHFRALAQSVVDRGLLWFGPPRAIREQVELHGGEHVRALVEQGRSFILLAPHFIGLDAAATRLTMEFPTGATMYTPQSDPGIDAVVRAGRTRFNDVRLVSRRDGVRGLIRHMREGRPLYYLPDMDFGRKGAVFVPFFGVPAATLPAAAQMARTWSLPVLPVLSYWDPDSGRYRIEVLPALPDFPGEDTLEDATARLNRELERWILRCPSQYYWVHRRFKTRPPGEPRLY